MRTGFLKPRWLALIALISGGLHAAAPGAADFHHTQWDGLGAVFDIKQSSEGYLWLTTSKGVVRFDGVQFQTVEAVLRGMVRDSEIDSVFLSSSRGLWLTTQGGGLLLWKDGKLTDFPDRRCTPTRKQGQLVEDADGTLWVQARAGLFRLRGTSCEQIGAESGYPGGFPAGLTLDSEGTIWVKTQSGPLLYLKRGQSKFRVNEFGSGLSTGYVHLHEGPDGTMWMSDDQGLRRVSSKPGAPAYAPKGRAKNDRFGDFAFAPDHSLWAVNRNGVKRFFDVEKWTTPVAAEMASSSAFTGEDGLTSDSLWKVVIDRERVWLGTNSGLDQLRRAVLTSARLPHAQKREFSLAAGEDGSIWTGNNSLALTHVAADGAIETIPETRQATVIRRDHNGVIWSAGGFKLWQSSAAGFKPVHYPEENLESVVFVAVDRNHDPWVTTSSSRTYRLSGGKWTNETQALGKKPGVTGTMVDDDEGNVWFAFSNKVVKWDGSDYQRFSFPDGQRGVSENTMSVRGDHVWLGGAGGVQLFTKGRFAIVRWKDDVLPGRVSGVVETKSGDLWVNGFSGITHVPAAELAKWIQDPNSQVSGEHLDEADGLPGLSGEVLPEPSVVEASDGRLWFATTKAIAWLDPMELEKNRNLLPPPVVISSVTADGTTYAGSEGLELPPLSENLEIDYAALSLTVPERMIFRYKLTGVDHDWQSAGTRRQAFYTKLRPGNYTFRVIARNNDGVWNEAGATLNFSISPAWFQSAWFFLFCLACGTLMVWAIYRLRMRQVAAGMNSRFQERLAERTRIAQELHDTLLQGFISASMHVNIATDRLEEDSPVKPGLKRAVQLMRQVIEEGRNAVQGLRAQNSPSLDLERAFASMQQDVAAGNPNRAPGGFRVTAEGQRRALRPILRDEVYRIGREALTNAVRHAQANHIEVELKYGVSKFVLVVRDDGRGIESDVQVSGRDGHWGMRGMRERADRIGARLRLMSGPSTGTEVELSVPAAVAYENPANARPRWFRRKERTTDEPANPRTQPQSSRGDHPSRPADAEVPRHGGELERQHRGL